jgi:hypothetical protein
MQRAGGVWCGDCWLLYDNGTTCCFLMAMLVRGVVSSVPDVSSVSYVTTSESDTVVVSDLGK